MLNVEKQTKKKIQKKEINASKIYSNSGKVCPAGQRAQKYLRPYLSLTSYSPSTSAV